MKHIKTISERGLAVDKFPDTYLAQVKKGTQEYKKYSEVAKDIYQMFKDLKWQDIKFETVATPRSGSTSKEVPILPAALRRKLLQAYKLDSDSTEKNFKQSGNIFAKTWYGDSMARVIHMNIEDVNGTQRSHFPDDGIPDSLKGYGLGYKLYRALLDKYKYLTSNTAGSKDKDRTWQSLISPKVDKRGRFTEDDVHSILGKDYVFAMVKNISDRKKIEIAKKFINDNVDTDEINNKNFGIDDELKDLLPEDVLVNLDPKKKAEKKKELVKTRLEKFTPRGRADHNWEIGDYVVDADDITSDDEDIKITVKKVVGKDSDGDFVAIELKNLVSYERGTYSSTTPYATSIKSFATTKNSWVKAKLQRGDVDPTEGRIPVDGARPARGARTSSSSDDSGHLSYAANPNNLRALNAFMDADMNWEILADDNDKAYIVRRDGGNITIMDGRINNETPISATDLRRMNLNNLNAFAVTSKSALRSGDLVFIKNHRRYYGVIATVDRVTPASNRQPGVYLKIPGEKRPIYFPDPTILIKVKLANESIDTGRHIQLFEDFNPNI